MFRRACADDEHLLGRSSRVVLSPRRWGQALRVGDVGPDGPTRRARRRWLTSPVHRGERGAAVKTIARGMPVVPAEPVVTAACFPYCRRAMGAACIRHSLRPLLSRDTNDASLGHFHAAGMRRHGQNLRAAHPSRRRFATPQDEDRTSGVRLDPHGEEPRSGVSGRCFASPGEP
jgi:hypothetical protein